MTASNHMSQAPSNDAQLVQRLIARDQNALSELYQQYGSLVFSIAVRVVQNQSTAEEVTQDTFLKIWKQSAHWDPARGGFVNWLATVTRYTAIDRLRRDQRRPLHHAVELDDQRLRGHGTNDNARAQAGELLRSLMERLPNEQMRVVELAFFQGMTHPEMADYLQLPLGTVKTRVRLGLQKLRTQWKEATEG